MSLYAIADLHLSVNGGKPMEVFGAHWAGHAEKIRARWREVVGPDDTVLVAGDISWGLRFEEALPDLEWLAALPGTKVLVRGNHDYWWSSKKSAAGLQAMLPPSLEVDGRRVGVVGSRGWTLPPATPEDAKIAATEEQRLRASVARLPPVDVVVGALHFPPFTTGLEDTVFVEILRAAGARVVVYGHIHRARERFVDGVRDGILYRNVASDQVGFCPQKLF